MKPYVRPSYERGKPRAAPACFPYDHPTLAEVDAQIAARRAVCAKAREANRKAWLRRIYATE